MYVICQCVCELLGRARVLLKRINLSPFLLSPFASVQDFAHLDVVSSTFRLASGISPWIFFRDLFIFFGFCFCCFCCFFAFVALLLLLLFCICCFSAFAAFLLLLLFLLLLRFGFLCFCLSALCFCCFSALAAAILSIFVFAFPFVCFLTFGSGVLLEGGAAPPQPPPRHEICTSSPTPAPATKSIF